MAPRSPGNGKTIFTIQTATLTVSCIDRNDAEKATRDNEVAAGSASRREQVVGFLLPVGQQPRVRFAAQFAGLGRG